MSLIEVKNLNKTFKKAIRGKGVKDMLKTLFSHKYENIEAVKDVSFNIEQGEIVVILVQMVLVNQQLLR